MVRRAAENIDVETETEAAAALSSGNAEEATMIRATRLRCRQEHKYSLVTPVLCLFGLGLIGLSALNVYTPLFVWNASSSAPIGLYRLLPGIAARGDLVLVRTPKSVRQLADERGYLPANVPLIKRIVGLQHDSVCASGDAIVINGQRVSDRLLNDKLGRPLPRWSGCHILNRDEVFLLMRDVSDSFDGRYFGPIRTTEIIGRLAPVWVE